MKTILFSFFLFAGISILVSSQNNFSGKSIYSFLENTGVYELNQEEGHTLQVPYSSVSEALINDREKSSAYLSLNGPWKFYYSDTPEATPAISQSAASCLKHTIHGDFNLISVSEAETLMKVEGSGRVVK
jgi:hypothetical protein